MPEGSTNNNVKDHRRANLLVLLNEFIDQQRKIHPDIGLAGLEGKFAQSLGIHRTLLSGLKRSRSMGPGLARRIEVAAAKPEWWMDRPYSGPPSELSAFLAAAERAYMCATPEARQHLMKAIETIAS
jgi:hypothetical protein